MEGGSANDYDYCSGDPVNCNDLDGNRRRPLTLKEAQAVAKTAGECTGGSRYLTGSSFCRRFLTALKKGNLTAFGFGFTPDNRRIPGQEYFAACVGGASTSALFGAVGGPGSAGVGAVEGCGAAVAGRFLKSNTSIPAPVVDAALAAYGGYGVAKEFRAGFRRVASGGRFLGS